MNLPVSFFLAFIFFERYYCFHLNRYKPALRLSYSFSCYQTTNHGLCYLFLFSLSYMEGSVYFFIIILHLVTSKKHKQANKDACCACLVLGIFNEVDHLTVIEHFYVCCSLLFSIRIGQGISSNNFDDEQI